MENVSAATKMAQFALVFCVNQMTHYSRPQGSKIIYEVNRTRFRKDIADILEIPQEQASSYFSFVSKLWGKHSPYGLERRRSEWVLTLHTAVTLIISIAAWCFVAAYEYLLRGIPLRLSIPILVIVLSVFFAIRLFKIADREREKSNQDFIIILKKNKTKILDSWNLELQEEKNDSDK